MAALLDGKVAIITGAASGFGEATAKLFAHEGAHVVLADIQEDRASEVAREIGGSALNARCDVTHEDDLESVVDLAVASFGRLDCMFNNAGIVGAVGPIDETPLEEFEYTMSVLLRSVFLGMKHAARVMKPQGHGVILSTSSIAGVQGGLGPHVYSTAKAAIIGLTRNVAAELGAWGIRVCAIAPGRSATPMNAAVKLGDPKKVNEVAKLLEDQMTPLPGRAGRASDVAQAALWLASDAAGFVSGHTVVIDGGLTTGSPEQPERGGGPFARRSSLIREAGNTGI